MGGGAGSSGRDVRGRYKRKAGIALLTFRECTSNDTHMPALQIVHGLPEQGPGAFIDRFVSASAVDPFSTWLILPTRRLVRTVKETCAGKNIPIISSRICTLDDLCSTYFEECRTTTRFISTPESKILLSQIINDHKKDLPLFFSGGHSSTGTVENFRDFINVITRRKIAYPYGTWRSPGREEPANRYCGEGIPGLS